MSFGDERTALVKLLGADGNERYLSMVRLDDLDAMAHDGWQILRELVGGPSAAAASDTAAASPPRASGEASGEEAMDCIRKLLSSYLKIEHGGGEADRALAETLFSPRCALLTVGSADPSEPRSAWSAPAGFLLEISLETYFEGVASQTTHAPESAAHDAIIAIDLLPCLTAASATLHVGNGARTNVFVDHLLLAKGDHGDGDGEWRIVSKVFSPRPWPVPPLPSAA